MTKKIEISFFNKLDNLNSKLIGTFIANLSSELNQGQILFSIFYYRWIFLTSSLCLLKHSYDCNSFEDDAALKKIIFQFLHESSRLFRGASPHEQDIADF